MAHAFGSIDELGDNYGFRKVRQPLGITAFGANVIVYPPGAQGVNHFHDVQDELYFVHSGTARFEVDGAATASRRSPGTTTSTSRRISGSRAAGSSCTPSTCVCTRATSHTSRTTPATAR